MPQDLLGTFLSHIPSHPNLFTFIQTDQRQIVEWEQRFFLMNLQYLFPYSASVFTAELYAIYFALVNIFSSASSCYTILSDSECAPSLVSPVDISFLGEENTGLAL